MLATVARPLRAPATSIAAAQFAGPWHAARRTGTPPAKTKWADSTSENCARLKTSTYGLVALFRGTLPLLSRPEAGPGRAARLHRHDPHGPSFCAGREIAREPDDQSEDDGAF